MTPEAFDAAFWRGRAAYDLGGSPDSYWASVEVGLGKPDPAIYRRADAVLGAAPRDIVFFDDRPANVEAAVAHGWDAHRWAGPAAAIAVLQRRGVLPAR